ncbi:MAG: hypothetical protein HZB67_00080 [Candidatus Aenigmarchaeota archaeon]|nr:hypothetical protein [Candidatus Aenigmarchaeota archaeon]
MHSKILIPVLILFLFSGFAFADTNGILNFTASGTTGIVTGLYGSALSYYCSSNAYCISGDACFIDYDHVSTTGYTGWCKPSTETACIHDNAWTTSGTIGCANSSHTTSCSSGVWTTTNCYLTNKTCSSGSCVTSTTSSSGGGSSSTTSNYSSIRISAYPSDFNITQGESAVKNITVNNSGTNTITDINLLITGIPSSYYSLSPSIISILGKNTVKNVTIVFAIPSTASVGAFNVTINASKNSTVHNAKSFVLRILPSNETASNLTPIYNDYYSQLALLEINISLLSLDGANVTTINASLAAIKSKLSQVNTSLAAKDYYTAGILLNEISSLISSLKADMANTTIPAEEQPVVIDIPWLYIGIVIVVAVVAVVLAYLFWPEKEEGYHPKKGWQVPKKNYPPPKKK